MSPGGAASTCGEIQLPEQAMGVGPRLRLDFRLAQQTAERLAGFADATNAQQPARAGQEMVV